MNTTFHNIVWLIRREVIEHRRLIWAPAIVGVVVIALNVLLLISSSIDRSTSRMNIHFGRGSLLEHLSIQLESLSASDTAALGQAIALLLLASLALFAVALGACMASYGVSCLVDERRDRSILFWKSLPVGDGESVAAKALTVLLVLPLVWIVAALITGWLSMAIYMIPLLIAGVQIPALFAETHLLAITGLTLTALPVHLLKLAPTIGWLMICSAIAPRPALPAILVPGLFAGLDALGLPNPVWYLLFGRLVPIDFTHALSTLDHGAGLGDVLAAVYRPVATIDLWIGVVFAVVCLVAATIYRRRFTTLI